MESEEYMCEKDHYKLMLIQNFDKNVNWEIGSNIFWLTKMKEM